MRDQGLKFVAYLRVSTARQGRSGLGLEAQREAVHRLVAECGGQIIAPEFVEIESGKNNARPKLTEAFKRCKQTGATLVIAKLDRLSRNAGFLMGLRDSGVQFIAADAPYADSLTVGVLALVAQREREAISQRTKAALAAAKRRGVKLGGYREQAPDISRFTKRSADVRKRAAQEFAETWRDTLLPLRRKGLSFAAIAERLNVEGNVTRHGAAWTPATVQRTVALLVS